jgi:hypothetical protein
MWDGTLPPKGSHFQVRNEACRVSDERKCKPDGGIASSHIIDHFWLFFSHHSTNYPTCITTIGKNKRFNEK